MLFHRCLGMFIHGFLAFLTISLISTAAPVTVLTTGGNADGAPCVFPFMYGNNQHYSCTRDGQNDGKLWCATTSDYKDGKWGFCPEVQTTGGNADGAPCVFPFINGNIQHYSCTRDGQNDGKLWCATTSDYKDGKWGFCPEVLTTGGNADGAPCVFPFVNGNIHHYSCTRDGHNDSKLWCATTSNYKDGKWGFCPEVQTTGGNADGAPCVFPFMYGNIQQYSCTRDGQKDGKLWCATTSDYKDGKWGFCPEVQTTGGNADGAPCVFPFMNRNIHHYSCTRDGQNDGKLWCATTSDYKDGKWGFCPEVLTTGGNADGAPCVFPFMYGNIQRYSCTRDGQKDGKLWCATTSDYKDGKWGFCPEEKLCGKPEEIANGRVLEGKPEYKHNEKASYECSAEYRLSEDGNTTCLLGRWENVPKCIYTSCEPPADIPHGEIREQKKNKYSSGDRVFYDCDPGYTTGLDNIDYITCEDARWTESACRMNCDAPPTVTYAEITERLNESYRSGSSVQYKCAHFYKLEGRERITCINGVWDKTPVCRVPCTVKEVALRQNNIHHTSEENKYKKIYKVHAEYTTFQCAPEYEILDSKLLTVQCLDGVINLPTCLKKGEFSL
ncbi:complement factor H-like isoform X2 [Hyperolius riggenbachi]|uniref:complement factor H-like isoform X2 n=1 Tax=Hyperolius riggenbachi TaxID=752182 RepID=UPI0035A30B2D